MIELVDTLPDINVQPSEYKRLLGYPRDRVLAGRERELADGARAWYAKNGKPWVYARRVDSLQIVDTTIAIDGVSFTSKNLQKTLQQADADGAIIVAVSAGPEVVAEAQRLWLEEKPDEYFFMEIYGSAVVEHLIMMTGARLCAWADGHGLAVLPHYSPGYPEWEITEQARLLDLIRKTRSQPLPGELSVMDSGMLRPKKSLLAVFGLTTHVDRVQRLTELVPCQNCSLTACQYRRAPWSRAPMRADGDIAIAEDAVVAEPEPVVIGLDHNAKYEVNAKALRRWADERLKLQFQDDGTIDAQFRYEGTTCSNMGRAILFDYKIKLSPATDGYLIRELNSAPAPGDEGYTHMCRYMSNAEHLMVAIDHEKPLLGQPLNDVLTWQRAKSGAGCYCEPNSRKHKWGLVLETLHFALVQREKVQSAPVPAGVTSQQ